MEMISKKAQGVEPPYYNYCSFWGAKPLEILVLALLSKCIDLASKVFCIAIIKLALLHGY